MKNMIIIVVVLFITSFCSSKKNTLLDHKNTSDDFSPTTDSDSITNDDSVTLKKNETTTSSLCAVLEPDKCKDTSKCHYSYGHKYDSERKCYGMKQIAGCLPNGHDCGAISPSVYDLKGNCWKIYDGPSCMPTGWRLAEGGCRTLDFCPENDPKECVDMDYGTCKRKSDQCKMVYGRMFEKKFGCLSTKTYIGCISKESQCNTSTVTATYSENCYHIPFGENCIPSNMKHERCYVDADICEWEK